VLSDLLLAQAVLSDLLLGQAVLSDADMPVGGTRGPPTNIKGFIAEQPGNVTVYSRTARDLIVGMSVPASHV
jgi:hypothetical protein